MMRRILSPRAVALVLLVGTLGSVQYAVRDSQAAPERPGDAHTQDGVLRTLVAGLRARETSVTTAHGYFAVEIYYSMAPELLEASKNAPPEERRPTENSLKVMFWAAEREKVRFDERYILPEGMKQYDLMTYDGVKVQKYEWGSSYAGEFRGTDAIGMGMCEVSGMLQLPVGCSGMELWSARLDAARPKAKVLGQESIGGVNTYRVSFPIAGDPLGEECWWIAPTLDCLIVMSETKLTHAGRPGKTRRYVRIVDEVRRAEGGPCIPLSRRHILYATLKEGKEQWSVMHSSHVQSVELNVPLAYGVFDLPFPLHTRVLSSGGGASYTVGGDLSAFKAAVMRGAPTPAALRAEPLGTLAASTDASQGDAK